MDRFLIYHRSNNMDEQPFTLTLISRASSQLTLSACTQSTERNYHAWRKPMQTQGEVATAKQKYPRFQPRIFSL